MRFERIAPMVQDRPVEALSYLRSIDTSLLNTRRSRADYALLMAMALDKNWIDTTDLGVVLPAVQYYSDHKPLTRRAKSYYYLGTIQFNRREYPYACVSFLKAEKYAKAVKDDRFKSLVYSALSSVFYNTSFSEEALRYDILSKEYSSKVCDSVGIMTSDYCIARDLASLGRVQEADSLYRQLVQSPALTVNVREAALSGYAMFLASERKDYNEAVCCFEKIIKECGSLPDESCKSAYAYSLLRIGRRADSDAVFDMIELSDSEDNLSFEKWKAMAEAHKGNFSDAYRWLDLESNARLENFRLVMRQSGIRAQRDFYEEEENIAVRKAYTQRLLAVIIILFVALIVSILLYAARNKNRKLLLERDSVKKRYIEMCRSNFGHVARVNELLTTTEDKDTKLYLRLKFNVQELQDDEKSQREFESMLNESFDNVMSHFREAFPERKPRFYRFASYVFAGFEPATISVLISDLSKDNVYVEKSRLKSRIMKLQGSSKEEFLRLLK